MNTTKLTVTIYSFSFKKGYPQDNSGNGGGYVFDCRAIPNPGVLEEYKKQTGMDFSVQTYLLEQQASHEFMQHTQALASISVKRYIEREFTSLMICFGCTGGQHRSVFFAEQMALFIHNTFGVKVLLVHREQGVEKRFDC